MPKIKHALAIAALMLLTPIAFAEPDYKPAGLDAPLDLSTPENAVHTLFRAMYLGDATLVGKVFADDGQLRRITPEGALQPDGLQRWRDWVSEQEEGNAVEEIFDVEAHAFGNLASVWAPFIVTYQDKIVGCGVNTFTLAKVDNDWRIIFGMDTGAGKDVDCATFKESYRGK
jgi:hypothetical protein